jgi:hypothetical protein
MVKFNGFIMKTVDSQAATTPPSMITSLMVGFDAVANHVGLILFPITLDLFLWLGPHVRMRNLTAQLFNDLLSMPGANGPETMEVMRFNQELLISIAERLNLMSLIRSYPVGIPSLMVSRMPLEAPAGSPVVLEVPSLTATVGLWLVFTFLGLVFGTLYFFVVERATLNGRIEWSRALREWPRASAQVVLLALFWVALMLGLSVPASCLITIVSLSGMGIGRIGIFVYSVLIAWLIYHLLFSSHGIFVNQRNAWGSIRDGVRISRMTFMNTFLLFLMIFILSEGLDVLWRVPAESSWLAVIGVIGHAFVATGLLAASFVYYRDANRFVERKVQQMKFLGM